MLKRSKDKKVTNKIRINKNGDAIPVLANSFGLPSGKEFSCPSATSVCEKVCYAGKLEKLRPSVRGVLMHNWQMLNGSSIERMTELLSKMMTGFYGECVEHDAPKVFRIHWDGDFFSGAYVVAWINVIRQFPDVQFWVYTRVKSASISLHTAKLPNLSLYFSGDTENLATALMLNKMGIKVAMLGATFDEAKELLGDAKSFRCPENNRALPLANENGSACVQCMGCVNGTSNVQFSVSKK